MKRFAWLLPLAGLLLAGVPTADAVVIRDDVPDLRYRMAAADCPALADLPFEGHGVLIAPTWVLTAAHAVTWQSSVEVVVVGGAPRAVRRMVVHPGYRKLPQAMIDAAMASDDTTAVMQFLAGSDDIALIELVEPVRDVVPLRIHEEDALGKEVRIVGRGATGNGAQGHPLHGPNRTDLRQGYNRIDSAEGRWIGYTFDAPPAALPLEAMAGNGDSGGPLLVAVGGDWQVVGLTSWKYVPGGAISTPPGRYGQVLYAVRLAHYRGWIADTLSGSGASR